MVYITRKVTERKKRFKKIKTCDCVAIYGHDPRAVVGLCRDQDGVKYACVTWECQKSPSLLQLALVKLRYAQALAEYYEKLYLTIARKRQKEFSQIA